MAASAVDFRASNGLVLGFANDNVPVHVKRRAMYFPRVEDFAARPCSQKEDIELAPISSCCRNSSYTPCSRTGIRPGDEIVLSSDAASVSSMTCCNEADRESVRAAECLVAFPSLEKENVRTHAAWTPAQDIAHRYRAGLRIPLDGTEEPGPHRTRKHSRSIRDSRTLVYNQHIHNVYDKSWKCDGCGTPFIKRYELTQHLCDCPKMLAIQDEMTSRPRAFSRVPAAVMDVFHTLLQPTTHTIRVVDMHTSGEPTRIVVSGYPPLSGSTLLEKRRSAQSTHDHIRQRLMREPRGHAEMRISRCCFNEGYSTMCGHATIALGRFLVDTHDLDVFPNREKLHHDAETGLTTLRLHAPCGLIRVQVPTILSDGTSKSDASKSVSFLGVPSYSTARGLKIAIPEEKRWPQLKDDDSEVVVDIAFGGAFYAIVSDTALGFPTGLRSASLVELDTATLALKSVIAESHKELLKHPDEDLRFLYSVIVVDTVTTFAEPDTELGICFFADQQIDRSPTGSGVMARVALAVDKGELRIGESRVYHSLVSLDADAGAGVGFRGTAVEMTEEGTIVRVEGRAFYTGAASFVVEDGDGLADGFVVG
uniref:trans-L-3-hydroxyproline dehydratase n=1 Tax=Mycena chlorophos TaxID=658473 RepID=A0ABQ0L8F0_MYCCL|nr:proline racemase [Mycena chlorophos]